VRRTRRKTRQVVLELPHRCLTFAKARASVALEAAIAAIKESSGR